MQQPLPNLVIAGAQKSGTTSLHNLLAGHPDVFFPREPQEIHFFDEEEAFARGLDWYAGLFTGWRGERYIGQTSPLYMFAPPVAERMAAVMPDARVLFILRNPVQRAYSHYWHEVRYGWEDRPFEEALELETERMGRGSRARRHYSYVARGRYTEQVERFCARFRREQLLVLFNEELHADPKATLARCAGFLGLDPRAFEGAERASHQNRAKIPRIPAVQRWVRGVRPTLPILGSIVDHLNLREARYPPMSESASVRLRSTFRGEAVRLRELTGADATPWWD